MNTRRTILLALFLLGGAAACDDPEFAAAAAATNAAGPKEPIVMMWQVQQSGPQGDFEKLKALGINTVQASRLASWPADQVKAYLDGAQKTGLKVIVFLGLFREGDDANCGYRDEALQFVRTYKSHPAIYAWHTVDEPAEHGITAACQRRLYKLVKAEDPSRPIMISTNNNTEAKYQQFFTEDAFDILEMHKYVNPRPGISQQRLMSLFTSNRKRSYPVIITLRAYNAPHKEKRESMTADSLEEQFEFFIKRPGLTRNVAFYGWDLNPSIGIKADPALQRQFEELMQRDKPAAR
jgi:hypothetical protein